MRSIFRKAQAKHRKTTQNLSSRSVKYPRRNLARRAELSRVGPITAEMLRAGGKTAHTAEKSGTLRCCTHWQGDEFGNGLCFVSVFRKCAIAHKTAKKLRPSEPRVRQSQPDPPPRNTAWVGNRNFLTVSVLRMVCQERIGRKSPALIREGGGNSRLLPPRFLLRFSNDDSGISPRSASRSQPRP